MSGGSPLEAPRGKGSDAPQSEAGRWPLLWYVLLAAALLLLSVFFYSETLFYFPSHIHAWTQSDRYAIALRFLDNGFNLFKPQTYNLSTLDGVTGVDLPLHDFFAALIMKALGTDSPTVFRAYTLCYSLLAYFFLFRLGREMTGSFFKAAVLVLFVFSCPIITYYQAGFIPSSTSFSTALMGYYFYFKFLKTSRAKHFYIAIALLTLAALSRMPFNIHLFAVLLQQSWICLQARKAPRRQVLAFSLAYASIIGYACYKSYLNATYGSQFLTSLLPAKDWATFKAVFAESVERWTYQVFSVYHYLLLGIACLAFLVHLFRHRRLSYMNRQILRQTLLLLAGATAHFLLLSRQFPAHEYYFLDGYYMGFVFLLLLGMDCIPHNNLPQRMLWGTLFLGLLLGASLESKKVQEEKYAEARWDRTEVTRKNFIGSAELLDGLGIPKTAKILVLEAHSTNAPLILMRRKGYTVVGVSDAEVVRKALQWDFDYIVVQDIFFPSEVVFHFPGILQGLERIGGNGKVSVYQWKTGGPPLTLTDALGVPATATAHRLDFDASEMPADWHNLTEITSREQHSAPHAYFMGEGVEFGPTWIKKIQADSCEKLLFEGYFLADGRIDGARIVVSATYGDGGEYYWDFSLGIQYGKQPRWRKYQCLFTLPEKTQGELSLKCFIWNTKKEAFFIDDIRLTPYGTSKK